ncbi:MAG: GGDEF domain-containing protein [Ruminococcaceae bacterium]|nr:GGDEF domain-containing protein [Oscillospiraceae bacterium]
MKNRKLLDKYRHSFARALLFTVILVTLTEFGIFAFLTAKGICQWSVNDNYFRMKVMLPVTLNWLILIITLPAVRSKKFSGTTKSRIITLGAMSVSFVVTIIHREYTVMMCSFIFPLILCANFNDKKLFNITGVYAFAIISVTSFLKVAQSEADTTTILNVVLIFGIYVVSCLTGYLSIKFAQKGFDLIRTQAQDNEQLQHVLTIDQMTGLYNHKSFYSELDKSIADFDNHNIGFCLAIIDIDNFKKVNDTFGHDRGDKVLETLAEVIKNNCAEDDIPCRYGGEEFAVIFNHKNVSRAQHFAKRILKAFSSVRYDFTDEKITFSCGIAPYKKNLQRQEFFDMADSGLYVAKETGKNRIITVLETNTKDASQM